MESLDKLEVKKEIDDGSLSSSDNIDNSVWESLKKEEALTDLQQDAMESKTDCSLATDQSVGNHSRYGTKEDHWRSPSSSVSNDQESKIYGNDLEKRCETLSFGLKPTTPNEEDVPLVKREEVDEDSPVEIKMDFDYGEFNIKIEHQPERLMAPSAKVLVKLQEAHPEAGCSSWNDVNHSRDELAEDHVGACDPLVTNDPEAAKYCVGSEMNHRTLIPCSNTITFNNSLTIDDEVYVYGLKQEENVSTPVEVFDEETEIPTMNQVDDEMFIATHSEQSKDQNFIKDRNIIKNCICDSCGFETSSLKILKRHKMKEHCDEKKFHCKFCDYKCSTSSHLNAHERIHTGEKPFNCKFCDYKCSRSSNLKQHVKTHTGEKPFNCKFCDYKCSVSFSLKSHVRTHTGEKPFHCKFCDYKCSTSSHLNAHERIHTGEKPFNCKFCDYKCSRSSHLKQHVKTHTGEKPFNCKFCDYKCSRPTDLKQHVRTHTGEKPFHCEFCDYKCSRSTHLKSHERTHTGEKLFNCKFCDYKCSRSSHLKRHVKTHTGEKPFNCKFCDYKCSVSFSLKFHERTHTGEKPFHCEFCDYKCSRSTHLKSHERTHTGEKPFHCKFCDYKCSHSSQLKRHVRTHTG